MDPERIGVIGFGEVGSTFSNAIAARGAWVSVYDILLEREGGLNELESRLGSEGIEFKSLEDVLLGCNLVLSVVTTQVAENVAKTCRPYLKPHHVFVDLNSTSPEVKMRIGHGIEMSGAHFIEGAILGAVGATGAKTRILLSGKKGKAIAQTLKLLGLNVDFYSLEIGTASMFKMLRGIFSKGLEALMLELMIAGRQAGIELDLWVDITEFMIENPFDKVAANWIQSHAVAHERRYNEMLQVVETMREVGVEPLMTSATLAFFKRSLSMDFSGTFDQKPDTYLETVVFMCQQLDGMTNQSQKV